MALLLTNDRVEWVSALPSGVKKEFEWRVSLDQFLELYMLKTTSFHATLLPEPYACQQAAAQFFVRAVPQATETRTREFLHGLFERDADYLLNHVSESEEEE